MRVHFFKRNFQDGQIVPDVSLKVKKYSKHAFGGPRTAIIEASGDDVELWEILELLRCPLEIYNDAGERVWWGMLRLVDLTAFNPNGQVSSRLKVGVDMLTMHNRVAIAYTQIDITTGLATRSTTAWADDLESQAEYGVKELLDSKNAATQEHAEAARDKTLSDLRYPISVVKPAPKANKSLAVLECSGWWPTLGWKYYSNPATDSVDTAEQAKDIITAKGQFFGTVYQDCTSGIAISEERDGDATALFEVMELLEMGTSNYKRMLAVVDPNRNVRIYEEPDPEDGAWLMLADGSLQNQYAEPIEKSTCPVGFWVVQSDMIPGSLNSRLFSDPVLKFVDEMEYDAEQDLLIPTAKDAPDPWDFPLIKSG